jgi:hypothetical protein
MSQYLLSCQCGETISVRNQQAGESVRCSCGRVLDVPTLRNLRKLPVVEQGQDESVAAGWTPLRGWLFAIGLPIILIAVVAICYCAFERRKLDLDKPPMEVLTRYHRDLTKIGLLDAWNIWTEVQKAPLSRRGTPTYLIHRQRARYLRYITMAALGLGLAGLVAVAVALVGVPRWRGP